MHLHISLINPPPLPMGRITAAANFNAVEHDEDGSNPHVHGTCRKRTNRRVWEDEAHLPTDGKKWEDDV